MSLRSPLLVLLSLVGLLSLVAPFGLAAPAVAGQGDAPSDTRPGAQQQDDQVVVTYEVTTAGEVRSDLRAFAATADEILGDARGWTLGGSIGFVEVEGGGDLTLVLASPAAVERAAPVCDRRYSCQVDDAVYINDHNWRNATPAWDATGAPLWRYRQYLVQHEVGHYLGQEHEECPGDGGTAPVMQQQSIALDGCEPNAWPLEHEREAVAARYEVPIHDWVFPDVLVGNVHRDAIHRIAEAGIARGTADGYYRPKRAVTRAQMATFLARSLELAADGDPPFSDVGPDDVHGDGIAATAEAGIVTGYEDGTYRPGREVSRGQMATMLARALELEATGAPRFDDVPEHHPHAAGIAAVDEAGIARGYDDGTYRPDASVERGQMASFLDRAGVAGQGDAGSTR